MSSDTSFTSHHMGGIILSGVEEVIGNAELEIVLRLAGLEAFIASSPPEPDAPAFPFDSVGRLVFALEQHYGMAAGQGVALRAGRACFKYALRQYGEALGVTEPAFRLLPFPVKLDQGAKKLSDFLNGHASHHVKIEATETHLLWHVAQCPLCQNRQAGAPSCHLAVGFFQDALYWLSGGKVFSVEETACMASGDAACTFRIAKTPLS